MTRPLAILQCLFACFCCLSAEDNAKLPGRSGYSVSVGLARDRRQAVVCNSASSPGDSAESQIVAQAHASAERAERTPFTCRRPLACKDYWLDTSTAECAALRRSCQGQALMRMIRTQDTSTKSKHLQGAKRRAVVLSKLLDARRPLHRPSSAAV